MEIRELISAARNIRPWALLVFALIAFQSLRNANPPSVKPLLVQVASR